MKVSAGNRGTSFSNDRQVTFTVTGLANNDYSRTADVVMNVPFTRMNETMRLVQRMGGKITGISVSGGLDAEIENPPAPEPACPPPLRRGAFCWPLKALAAQAISHLR
jgi:phycocyanin-associated rod protein